MEEQRRRPWLRPNHGAVAILVLGSGFAAFARISGYAEKGDWATIVFAVSVNVACFGLLVLIFLWFYHRYSVLIQEAARLSGERASSLSFFAWKDRSWTSEGRKFGASAHIRGPGLIVTADANGLKFATASGLASPIKSVAWSAIAAIGVVPKVSFRYSTKGLEISEREPAVTYSFRVTPVGNRRPVFALEGQVTELADELRVMWRAAAAKSAP